MSFSESTLQKKLLELNSTQQSVQTLSLWLIHHRKHSRTVVASWLKELTNASKCDRKLTYIYLANDILQNSRKKGNEYLIEFARLLPDAIENTAKYSDDKIRFTLERILNIWKDRKIYADDKIEQLRKIMHETPCVGDLHSPPINSDQYSPTEVKRKPLPSSLSKSAIIKEKGSMSENTPASAEAGNDASVKKRKMSPNKSDPSTQAGSGSGSSEAKTCQPSSATTVATATVAAVAAKTMSLREEIGKELALIADPNAQLPESAELVSLLSELEKSASSDAVVREKIAELPSRVNDLNELKNLKDKSEALELSNTVNDALQLLDSYNARLQQELVSRKQTALLLALFVRHQRSECESDEKLADEWQRKLKQVEQVKQDLKVHLQNLPDLSSIEEAAELTPLPSAGDLFSSAS